MNSSQASAGNHIEEGNNDSSKVDDTQNNAETGSAGSAPLPPNKEESTVAPLKIEDNEDISQNPPVNERDIGPDDSDSDVEIVGVMQNAISKPQNQGGPTGNSTEMVASMAQNQNQPNHRTGTQNPTMNAANRPTNVASHQQQQHQGQEPFTPRPFMSYDLSNLPILANYSATWEKVWPQDDTTPAPMARATNQIQAYRLTLLSNAEFTITAVTHHTNSYDFQPSLFGLRKPIKDITRIYGNKGEKALLEDGRWRIPLSVYQAFLSYLNSQQNTVIYPIPVAQIKIASLGKAAAERGYPSVNELVQNGVPTGLASALAPYQRGGVDFVMQRQGKALIADDMGLGKTVQGIASMACFSKEWPLLVLSPSTARYHWEAEFLNWLGKDSEVNKTEIEDTEDLGGGDLFFEEKKADGNDIDIDFSNKRKRDTDDGQQPRKKNTSTMNLLSRFEVNVLTSSSDAMFKPNTRVVIISYGLIPNLMKKGILLPGLFKCIIVDESHMLKNKKSKRTQAVMPLLKKATRVVMLSGTPALAKPQELFPQLNALGEHNGWWDDENDFNDKYVNDKYSDPSFAELHTLLTSTVMIRRLKVDVLKDMPSKMRENVFLKIRCPDAERKIVNLLFELRSGKGVLGKLSVLHQKNLKHTHQLDSTGNSSENITSPAQQVVSDSGSRKAALNEVFRLTGNAKIPIVVDMLKRWLKDPMNGKICVFAHHVNVLDALVHETGLSNASGSISEYIRIDGSTQPRARQDQITRFQNDPNVRVAILSITAAGVGVTLTAASTIWFAELFWTPALMIQAEDRCHRIGQQARVKCLYTIARNTLDEVLWILLKRKFRALGEFVEGKEMMDITVHTTYNNEFDAVDRKSDLEATSDSEEDSKNVAEALADEGSIQDDIEELALEDMKNSGVNDDDCIGDEEAVPSRGQKSGSSQTSSNEIICLSDDEDDVHDNVKVDEGSNKTVVEDTSIEQVLQSYMKSFGAKIPSVKPETNLQNLSYFYVFFVGSRYGIRFLPFCGRVVVEASNPGVKGPEFGDIIVAINSWSIPASFDFHRVIEHLKQALNTAPVRLVFARNVHLTALMEEWRKRLRESNRLRRQSSTENQSGAHLGRKLQPSMSSRLDTPQRSSSEVPSQTGQTDNSSSKKGDCVIEILDD